MCSPLRGEAGLPFVTPLLETAGVPDVPTRQWSVRLARALRTEMTEPERRLWHALRLDLPWKFRRQQPIGPYICDFVCVPKRLIVEVNGAQHGEPGFDSERDCYLRGLGFRVVRVWNDDVMLRPGQVLDTISAALDEQIDVHRNRPPREGGW